MDTTQTTVNASTIYYDDSFERFTVNGRGGNDYIIVNGHPPVITQLLGGEGDDRFDIVVVKQNGIALIDGQNGNDTYWLVDPPALLGPVNINDSGNVAGDVDYLMQGATDGADNVTVTSSGITGMSVNLAAFLQFVGIEGLGLELRGGNDTVSISGVPNGYALEVWGGDGNDTFSVSNLSGLPNYNLRVFGGNGVDSLTIDASAGNSGTLTDDSLSGFGLLKPLVYETFENITLNLSGGNDTLEVNSTNNSTTINGNNGNETFHVNLTGGTTTINGGNGTETFHVNLTGRHNDD